MQLVSEKDIEKNTVVKEKEKSVKEIMKDLEDTLNKGLISKESYDLARKQIISKFFGSSSNLSQEVKKDSKIDSIKVEPKKGMNKRMEDKKIPNKDIGVNENNDNKIINSLQLGQTNKQNCCSKLADNNIKADKEISFLKKKHIEQLKRMEQSWINDLESLKGLYEHGVISEEEYNKSKEDIEEKVEKIEDLIKKELEEEEIENLKSRVEEEIRDALNNGVFKEDEAKLRRDIEALNSLYARGLISSKEYEEKKKALEDQLSNYSKLIELIDAVFNKFIDELNKKIEENKVFEKEEKKEQEDVKRNDTLQQKTNYPWYIRLLSKLGLYDIPEEDISNKNSLVDEIKKVYAESEMRFKISNMASVIKRYVKEILGIEKAITYRELIDLLDKSDVFSDNIKVKLKAYFNEVMLKEYLEEDNEEDIESLYKESMEIARLLEEGKNLKSRIKKVQDVKEGNKEKKENITKERDQSTIEDTEKAEKSEKKPEDSAHSNHKKGLFERINDFFGV